MKIKIQIIIITLIALYSCNNNAETASVKTITTVESLNESEIINENDFDKVLKILTTDRIDADSPYVSGFKCSANFPSDTNKVIVVIPLFTEPPSESEWNADLYIVIFNRKENLIENRFYKQSAISSDALRVMNISIDSSFYKVNDNETAFGVKIAYAGSSNVFPYGVEYISLYVPQKDSLCEILHNYPLNYYSGQNVMNCFDNHYSESTCKFAPATNNLNQKKYNDILVNIYEEGVSYSKRPTSNESENEEGNDCDEHKYENIDYDTISVGSNGLYHFKNRQ